MAARVLAPRLGWRGRRRGRRLIADTDTNGE
jgi:hypothetical protein